jgi:hypothetical protein
MGTPMARQRATPPTTSSVRGLATRRAYLLKREEREPFGFRMFSLCGQKVAAVSSDDPKHRYSWRLADADAWLRKQPLLRNQ